jgi:transposase
MSTQEALPLPSLEASDTVVINARCTVRGEGEQRVLIVNGVPTHHFHADDPIAEAYAMVFLVDSGFAQQNDVARAFGRSERTVRRYQQRYADGGMSALGRERGWRRGRRRISGKRLRAIETLRSQGQSNRQIAHRLGIDEKTVRKQVGPSKQAEQLLAFPAVKGDPVAGPLSALVRMPTRGFVQKVVECRMFLRRPA